MPGSRIPCARLPAQSLADPCHQWRGGEHTIYQLSEETPDKPQLPWGLRQADSQLVGVLEAEGQPDRSLSSAVSFTPEQASVLASTQTGASSKARRREPRPARQAHPVTRKLVSPAAGNQHRTYRDALFPGKEALPTPLK